MDDLVTVASEMMQRAARPTESVGRDFGGGMDKPWVYGRSRRPCHRCGTRIETRALGSPLPRTVYWCPRCQVRP